MSRNAEPIVPPIAGLLPKHGPKSRSVLLDLDAVERRLAQAIWRECSRLLVRRMTPDARQLVIDTQERVEPKAGIRLGPA